MVSLLKKRIILINCRPLQASPKKYRAMLQNWKSIPAKFVEACKVLIMMVILQ